jgi:hypothetical protein
MHERRKLQRLRALKVGTISLSQARGIICRVRNMSPAGACLEVTSHNVIWRSETKLGVQFSHPSAGHDADMTR